MLSVLGVLTQVVLLILFKKCFWRFPLAQILHYPSTPDRKLVYSSIQSFLQDQHGLMRDLMLDNMGRFLSKYKISKCNFNNFSIYLNSASKVAYICAKEQTTDKNCPGCGKEIFSFNSPVRILGIEEAINDRVTYGCGCGEIFFRVEEKC